MDLLFLFRLWLIGTVIFGPSTLIILGVIAVSVFGVTR